MKRLVVLFLALVVIGAVVFYFGWIQIKLDEDEYAAIFTKTGGWEESVVSPGEFTWRVQRLLPTNLSLHVVPVTAHSLSASLRGSLPGSATYGTLIEAPSPFAYAVSVDIVYRLKPDSLPRLVRDEGLRADNIGDFYRRTDSALEQIITEQTLTLVSQPDSLLQPSSAYGAIADTLKSALERLNPGLDIVSVTPTRVELPDIDLYLQTKERYLTLLDQRAAALAEAAMDLAADQTATDAGLAKLERYGEILERYPILLEYFTLSQDNPGDLLDLESLIPQPGT